MTNLVKVTELDKYFGRLQVLKKINLVVNQRRLSASLGEVAQEKALFYDV